MNGEPAIEIHLVSTRESNNRGFSVSFSEVGLQLTRKSSSIKAMICQKAIMNAPTKK